MSPRAAARLESLGFGEVYEYSAGKQDWVTAGLPTERADDAPRAGDLARDDVPTCTLDERLGDVAERTERAGFDTAMAVNDPGDRIVLGILRSKHLNKDPDLTVEEAMSAGPSTFRPNVDVPSLAHLMAEHDLPDLPITTNDGRLVGLLLREDAERVAREQHEEHGHEQ